ncbi:MAG: hypothetical protein J7K69_01200 [Thermotogae bacterium]|nr:hypothetical protein [Thermotogota bacterium]
MRRIISIFLIILSSLFSLIFASNDDKPLSVIYQVEIVELNEELLSSVGLLDSNFSNVSDKGFGIYYINSSKELLLKLPYSQVILSSEKSSRKESRSSRFWLVTNFNQAAHLTAEQELIDVKSGQTVTTGIDISVKPLKIDEGAVLTDFKVLSLPNSNLLNTTVWIETNKFLPLAIITFKSGYDNMASWYLESKSKMRYFAVYAKCSLVKELPKEDVYLIGSVDGFSKMFWQIPEYPKENYLKIYLGSKNTGYVPCFEVSFWPKNELRLDLQIQLTKFPDLLGEIELRPFKDDFRLCGRAMYVQSTKTMSLVFGMSDHVYYRLFTLSAGYYPVVLNLKNLSFEKAMWWFKVNTDVDGSKLAIGLDSKEELIDLIGEANLKVSENFYLLGKLDYSINTKQFLLSMGIRLDF